MTMNPDNNGFCGPAKPVNRSLLLLGLALLLRRRPGYRDPASEPACLR